MPYRLEIPPRECWPEGFTTDFVTGWFDWIWSIRDQRWLDARKPAFWHDISYWYGAPVHPETPWEALKGLKPLPNSSRSRRLKRQIDNLFEYYLLEIGFDEGFRWLWNKVMRLASGIGRNYWRG